MNRAIDTLPELTEQLKGLDKRIADFKVRTVRHT